MIYEYLWSDKEKTYDAQEILNMLVKEGFKVRMVIVDNYMRSVKVELTEELSEKDKARLDDFFKKLFLR